MKIATITKTMDQLREELDQLRPIAEDKARRYLQSRLMKGRSFRHSG